MSVCGLTLTSSARVSPHQEGASRIQAAAAVKDVTASVEDLGQPSSAAVYARNVWDLQVFNKKIYIGQGNSSNVAPAPNAGPIPITTYDTTQGKFTLEPLVYSPPSGIKNVVDEEQIDIFKVLNGSLYIPGHDATESQAHGNFYKLDPNGNWYKYRKIPAGVHVYDMAWFGGRLFAAVAEGSSSGATTATVMMSEDGGQTWPTKWQVALYGHQRAYTLFELNGKLHASNAMPMQNNKWGDGARLLEISSVTKDGVQSIEARQIDVTGRAMFPGLYRTNPTVVPSARMVRTTPVGGKLMYIAGEIVNDHQWVSQGLFLASGINTATRLTLPVTDALPMDILVRGTEVYVLVHLKTGSSAYTNLVYRASVTAPTTWTEVFRFNRDTFARSFEELNGDFYFGLGCHTDVQPASTGSLLRVKRVSY
ncbi:hypothetical protein [Cystobacter ferrugineus]|uniref:hypothetical protein n=1 Tax=Cystobacter ferrugineus TaxID=83449 RepID=UPI00116138CA|nr:hypothetical protein [Cystobacter ferrugineus]